MIKFIKKQLIVIKFNKIISKIDFNSNENDKKLFKKCLSYIEKGKNKEYLRSYYESINKFYFDEVVELLKKSTDIYQKYL